MSSLFNKTFDFITTRFSHSEQVHDSLIRETLDDGEDVETEIKPDFSDSGEGRFEKEGILGEGGMGFVFSAFDTILHRRVAIKSLLRTVNPSSTYWKRFYREAQITAQLAHPSIVPVYSIEFDKNQQPNLIMKMVQGVTLDEYMQQCIQLMGTDDFIASKHGLLPRIEMMIKICDAIYYAHTRGVIHRDLKPDNIMVGEFEDVYVMDWGLARPRKEDDFAQELIKKIEDHGLKTRDGAIIGTPIYMSPEQAEGDLDRVSYASDQYCLGMILYEMVSLKQARKSESVPELIQQARSGILIDFADDCKGVDPRLKSIILKACHKNIKKRYPSMKMLAHDLRRFTHNKSVWAHQDSLLVSLGRFFINRPVLSIFLILILIVIAGSSAIMSLYSTLQSNELAQQRQEITTNILNETLTETRNLDQFFVEPQIEVQQLATLTRFKLQNLPIDIDTCLRMNQLTNTPDFKKHPRYKDAISLRKSRCFLPSGVSKEDAQIGLSLAADMQSNVKELFSGYTPREQFERSFWRKDSSAIQWIYLGYQDGTSFSYPATTDKNLLKDPRLRPWYKDGLAHSTAKCGRPYPDASSSSYLTPCTQQILDIRNDPVGVVGIDFRMDNFIKRLENIRYPKLKSSYILDKKGKILFSSRVKGKNSDAETIAEEEKIFKDASFVHELEKGQSSGLMETDLALYSCSRLQSVPWTLVLIFENDILSCPTCF